MKTNFKGSHSDTITLSADACDNFGAAFIFCRSADTQI